MIIQEVQRRLERLEAESPQPAAVILAIPLLFEAGWENHVDIVVSIQCTPAQQKERLMQRDGITETLATQMINSQMSLAEKAERSDIVIDNSGAEEELIKKVETFAKTLD